MRKTILVCTALAVAACGNPNDLPNARISNVVDTATIAALTGTDIALPSAFSVSLGQPVRTDLSAEFDFAFDIRSGTPVLLPRAALNFPSNGQLSPGLLLTELAFDAITLAASNGFATRDTIAIVAGDRFYARSRVVCSSLGVPLYGKLEILSVDPAARSLTFKFLVNENCGYVGLAPGVPEE